MKAGGKRENAGRKPKADEQKTNTIFLEAIKRVKNVETDDEARIEMAKDLLTFERGQIFISEHLFGKPKETIDNNVTLTDLNIKEIVNFK
jgi:hypothetical protein